jgi:hypothetical protein
MIAFSANTRRRHQPLRIERYFFEGTANSRSTTCFCSTSVVDAATRR